MGFEVDFITLGDASEKLSVPSATLRHWTDQMEEFDTHYVLRNNRNERIYYDTDIKVFEFLRDLKNEHGRRTTTKDLAYMIADRGRAGEFQLRTKEDAPQPQQPSNRTADLLNQDDIKRLMESERVKQFIGIVIDETTKNIKQDLVEEVRKEVQTEMLEVNQHIVKSHESLEKAIKESDEKWEARMKAREEQTNEYIAELRAKRERPWWKKIFSD